MENIETLSVDTESPAGEYEALKSTAMEMEADPVMVGQLEQSYQEQKTEPVEMSEPIASLSSMGVKMTKKLFKDAPIEKKPPKKYIEQRTLQDIDAISQGNMTPDEVVGRSTSEFRSDDPWQINFDTLENEDDVNGMVGAIAENYKAQTMEARGGIQKDEQVMELAKDIGADPTFVADFISSKDNKQFTSPEQILAARSILNQSAIKLKELADMVVNNEASDKDKLAFHKQFAFHRQFMTQFMAQRANVGRALRAYSLPTVGSQMQKDAMQNMLMGVHSGLDINTAAKQIALAPNARGVNQMVQAQDGLLKKAGNVFIENFINSILSGVKTHIINTTGSAMMIGTHSIDSFVAARLGTKVGDTAEKMALDEWKAGLFGLQMGFQDALGVAMKTARTAEPYGGVSKMETEGRKYISGEYLGLTGKAGTAADVIGEIVRAPTERLMGGTDAFMKRIAERQQLAQVAWRRVSNESEAMGLNQKEATELLEYYMQNPTQDMIEEATENSLHVTFQTPLGPMGQKIQKIAGHNPVTQYFMPFVKTPINLMKQGFLERTPLAMITKEYQDAMNAGGARAQMAKARMYVGTAFTMSVASAVMAKSEDFEITGAGPSDFKAKAALMETGWRPYSVKVGGKYYSYQRTEPFSYIIGTIAEFAEVMRNKPKLSEDEERYAERVMGALGTAVSHATLDRSFLLGVQNMMDVLNSGSGSKWEKFFANMAASTVPYQGMRRDISRLFDDTRKITDGALSQIKSQTPYFSETVPPNRDSFGNVLEFDAVLNPFPVVDEKKDRAVMKIAEITRATQKSPNALPDKIYNSIRLTPEQYHDMIYLSRKKIRIEGMTYEEKINDLIDSGFLDDYIEEKQADIIKDITNDYDTQGRLAMAKNHPDLLKRLGKKRMVVNVSQLAKSRGDSTEFLLLENIDKFINSVQDTDFEIDDPEDKQLYYNKEK